MSNKSRHDVSRTNWDVSRFRGDVFKNVFMNIFAPSLDKADVKATKNGVTPHYGTWIIYYLIIASISFIGILAGSVNLFVESIPQNLMNGLSAAGGLLPAVGFAMLMKLLWDNKLAVFTF